jgi:hypothetical protein
MILTNGHQKKNKRTQSIEILRNVQLCLHTKIHYIYVGLREELNRLLLLKKQVHNDPTRAFLVSLRLSAPFLVAEPLLGVD